MKCPRCDHKLVTQPRRDEVVCKRILSLRLKGKTVSEIAKIMTISERTIYYILRKLTRDSDAS